jgi:hypothetical protein
VVGSPRCVVKRDTISSCLTLTVLICDQFRPPSILDTPTPAHHIHCQRNNSTATRPTAARQTRQTPAHHIHRQCSNPTATRPTAAQRIRQHEWRRIAKGLGTGGLERAPRGRATYGSTFSLLSLSPAHGNNASPTPRLNDG